MLTPSVVKLHIAEKAVKMVKLKIRIELLYPLPIQICNKSCGEVKSNSVKLIDTSKFSPS